MAELDELVAEKVSEILQQRGERNDENKCLCLKSRLTGLSNVPMV